MNRITFVFVLKLQMIGIQLYVNNLIFFSKKESLLLNLLVKNKDKVSTIDEIFHTLWQEDFQKATMKSLKAIISRFRRKYPDIKIENVYSLGYKLQQIHNKS